MDEELNNSACMTYLGLACLLGRIAGRARLNRDDEEVLERAFADANRIMTARYSEQVFIKTHDGGYSLFEKSTWEG